MKPVDGRRSQGDGPMYSLRSEVSPRCPERPEVGAVHRDHLGVLSS